MVPSLKKISYLMPLQYIANGSHDGSLSNGNAQILQTEEPLLMLHLVTDLNTWQLWQYRSETVLNTDSNEEKESKPATLGKRKHTLFTPSSDLCIILNSFSLSQSFWALLLDFKLSLAAVSIGSYPMVSMLPLSFSLVKLMSILNFWSVSPNKYLS